MPRRFSHSALSLALVLGVVVVACEHPSEPTAAADGARAFEEGPSSARTFATFLAPRTIVRAGSAPQYDTIPLDDLPLERFTGPFRLIVEEHAGPDVLGTISLDGVVIVRMGTVTPSITRTIQPHAGSRLELRLSGAPGGAITLRVEGAIQPAPRIRITGPARATMLRRGGLDSLAVLVRGSACHGEYPIVELTVNGAPLAVSGDSLCEAFAVDVASPWGLTTVDVYARNSRGRDARVVQSFLRSRSFNEPTVALPGSLAYDSMVDVSSAALLRFSSAGFNKLTAPIPGALNDAGFGDGISSARNESRFPCYRWEFQRDSVQSNIDAVNLSIVNNSTLNVAVQYDITLFFRATFVRPGPFPCTGGSDPGTGTLRLTNATLDGDVDFSIVPTVGGVDVSVDLANLDISSYVFATSGFGNDARTFLQDLEDAVVDFMGTELGTEAQELMEIAAQVGVPFQNAELPTASLNALGLDFHHAAHSVQLRTDREDVFYRTRVAPMVPRAGDAPARGSIRTRLEPSAVVPAFDVSAYASDDFVNQVLWAAWQAGHFDDDELELAAGLSAEMYSLLPPVMMPGDGPRVRFGWGDVRLSALVDPAQFGLGDQSPGAVPVTAYGRVFVDTRLRADSLDNIFELRGPTTHAEIEVVSPPGTLLDEEALRDAFATALGELALARIRTVIEAVPLLEADLTGFFGAPPGYMLDLNDFNGRAGRFHRTSGTIGAF